MNEEKQEYEESSMKDTGTGESISCTDRPHVPAGPDLWSDRTRAHEMKMNELEKIRERLPYENTLIKVMKEMIEYGELTFTSDGRAILQYPPPAKNHRSSCSIGISEDVLL